MNFIAESKFERQISLLHALASNEKERPVAALWLYPEKKRSTISGLVVTRISATLSPVTTYSEGVVARCTTPHAFDEQFVSRLRAHKVTILKNCDSIALYRPGESAWFACAIPHEGMCLAKDESALAYLVGLGFSASTSAPSWW